MSLTLAQLIPGQRYLFHESCYEGQQPSCFRANFVEVSNTRLLVDFYESCNRKLEKGKWSIPVQWIVKVETLDDILDHDTSVILPNDILLEIDNYF
jgi:hypothetical protein